MTTKHQDHQILLQPAGYEPLPIPIVGTRYEDRSQTVLRSSLRERVWLHREPDNPFDRNAISVKNLSGQMLGHVGTHLAAKLAPHMDACESPSQAVVTQLTSNISGSEVGATLSVYVPACVYSEVMSCTPKIEYFCDTSSVGAIYLFLDCDEGSLNHVTEGLMQDGLSWKRFGISYRPATNGRHYRWYVVLEDRISPENVERFFRERFGILSDTERKNQELEEWLKDYDVEHANLLEQIEYLKSIIAKQREEIINAYKTLADREQVLKKTEHQKRNVWMDEVLRVIHIFLPNIVFLRDSIAVIKNELEEYRDLLQRLHSISVNSAHVRAKPVKSTDGYRELRFRTGQKDDGRIYFKQDKDELRTLIGFKAEQLRDIEYLKKR